MRRMLKSNTSKTRSHSLFRQGCMLYELIPNMPEHRLAPLMTAFAQAVAHASAFTGLLQSRNEWMIEGQGASAGTLQETRGTRADPSPRTRWRPTAKKGGPSGPFATARLDEPSMLVNAHPQFICHAEIGLRRQQTWPGAAVEPEHRSAESSQAGLKGRGDRTGATQPARSRVAQHSAGSHKARWSVGRVAARAMHAGPIGRPGRPALGTSHAARRSPVAPCRRPIGPAMVGRGQFRARRAGVGANRGPARNRP